MAQRQLCKDEKNDRTAVASDGPTGIVPMENVEASDSVRVVRALGNAGSHATAAPELTKNQKRKQKKRKQKKRAADEFVLVAADDNSEMTDETDLDSLASSHPCVHNLVEDYKQLSADHKQLSAALRGTRLLLRDPSARLLQRVGRGFVARRRAARVLRAAVKIQAASRASLGVARRHALLCSIVSLQSQVRVRQAGAVIYRKQSIAASITIASCARRYLVLTTTVVGKLLSRTRLQAIELECMEEDLERQAAELKKTKERLAAVEKAEAQQAAELEKTTERLAAVEKAEAQQAAELEKTTERLASAKRDIKMTTKMMFCPDLLPQFLTKVIQGEGTSAATLAELFVKNKVKVSVRGSSLGFKVLSHGKENYEKYWAGTITKVLKDGKYEVTFDALGTKNTNSPFIQSIPGKKIRIVEPPKRAPLLDV